MTMMTRTYPKKQMTGKKVKRKMTGILTLTSLIFLNRKVVPKNLLPVKKVQRKKMILKSMKTSKSLISLATAALMMKMMIFR